MNIPDQPHHDADIAEEKTEYQVALPDFYGPMDLLLSLIEQEELEITTIALAQVTDQFLDYVTTLKEINPDNLTDFLVVASKLILIKSEVLLPKPPASIITDEDGETDDLVQQLKDYKRFKELAQSLQVIEATGRRNFVRLAAPVKVEPKLRPGEASVSELLSAVRRALTVKPEQPGVDMVVARQVVTIGQQINLIRLRLAEPEQLSFEALLSESRSRVEVIVTFLAVLELLKRRLIDIIQENDFGQIMLTRREQADLEAADQETSDWSTADWSELETITEIS